MTGRRLRRLLPLLTLTLVACNPIAPGPGPPSSPKSSGVAAGTGLATAAAPRLSGLIKPYGVAVGEGSVWVTEYEPGYLVRIDPATNKIVARIHVGPHASHVLIQDGSAWVLDDLGIALIRVDVASNKVADRIPLRGWPSDLAGSAGSVWVTMESNALPTLHGELMRIDTATSAVTSTQINGVPAGIVLGGGAVWVSSMLLEPTSIFRIDPATNRVVARIETGHPISAPLAYGDSGLWVANSDGFLTHIDSRTNKVVGNFDVGSPEWAAMLAVGKDLWISAPLDNILARFDPVTGTVTRTLRAGSRPQVFALLGSDLWVVNYLDGTLVKLPIN
jgi:DNA-binding beta-propeller fold protein YncE